MHGEKPYQGSVICGLTSVTSVCKLVVLCFFFKYKSSPKNHVTVEAIYICECVCVCVCVCVCARVCVCLQSTLVYCKTSVSTENLQESNSCNNQIKL